MRAGQLGCFDLLARSLLGWRVRGSACSYKQEVCGSSGYRPLNLAVRKNPQRCWRRSIDLRAVSIRIPRTTSRCRSPAFTPGSAAPCAGSDEGSLVAMGERASDRSRPCMHSELFIGVLEMLADGVRRHE